MAAACEERFTLRAIVPSGGGECSEFDIEASPQDTGARLKGRIEERCRIPAEDLELFFSRESDACRGADGAPRQSWLREDATLRQQGVPNGAAIAVGVRGLASGLGLGEEGSEEARGAVGGSLARRGDSSYYHAHARPCSLPEELRIVSGGPPMRLSDDLVVPLREPKTLKQQLEESEGAAGRPERPIRSYSWGDERDTVKVYISKDGEPEAVGLAGDGGNGQVVVKWGSKSLKMTVKAEKTDYVLELNRIYYEIIPEQCRFRVSPDKRISLILKKKEPYTWMKLLKPET